MRFFGIGKKSSDSGIVKQEDGTFFYPICAGKSFISGPIEDKRRLELFLTVPELNAMLNLRARASSARRAAVAIWFCITSGPPV